MTELNNDRITLSQFDAIVREAERARARHLRELVVSAWKAVTGARTHAERPGTVDA